jgi:beta-galactosidase
MSVLLRPGPYVCAEWDFGGLPVRLYSVPNMTIRANNPQFLSEVKIYFGAIAPIIKEHIKSEKNPKGSIFLLQI